MTSVLACDPDQLEATAVGLRHAAAELDLSAAEIGGSADVAWSGLAALEQAARRAEISAAVSQLATPLEQVAGALVEVALAAREHGDTVRRHARLRDEVELERSRLIALGSPPEPLAAAHWSEQVAWLGDEVARHQKGIGEAEREFQQVRSRVTRLLDEVRALIPQILWDLALTSTTVQHVVKGRRQAAAAGALADSARRLRRMRVPGGERTLHVMRQRVDRHVRHLKMRAPDWVSRVPGGARVAGRVLPVVAFVDAGHGVVTGGGYDGWRGGLTRGLGAMGMVGAGVALVVGGVAVGVGAGVAAPFAAVAGLSLVAIYQVWMTGNWVYDNRERIAGLASRAWSGTRTVGGRVWRGGRNLVGRARERATSGLGRLRERLGRRDRRPGDDGHLVAPGRAPAGAHA